MSTLEMEFKCVNIKYENLLLAKKFFDHYFQITYLKFLMLILNIRTIKQFAALAHKIYTL
jgi:hypothetical protein